jgi:AcrR family transcriptional regulator
VAVEDILDVAMELFGRRGIHGTTIAAIADRFGITDGGLLHHFPTKSALVDAVIERAAQLQLEQMRQFVEPGGLEAIKALSAWGTVVEATPQLTAFSIVLSTEAIFDDSVVRDWVQRRYVAVQGLVSSLIREGIENGDIRPDVDADWEASAVIAFLDGIRLQWFYSDHTMPLAEVVKRYFDQLVERLTHENHV